MRILYNEYGWVVLLPGIRASVAIVHLCDAFLRAQQPGGMLKIPAVNNFECRYCWKRAPAEAEAIFHTAKMCK